MEAKDSIVGLVLTGGGAKGAYQVGALRYLAEVDFFPDIIAGTSIGALNGAVLASHRSFEQATQQLDCLWDQLGRAEILSPNPTAGLHLLSYVTQTAVPTFGHWAQEFLCAAEVLPHHTTLFNPEPIERLLQESVNATALRQGIELWVTVFPSLRIPGLKYDLLMVLVDLLRAQLGTNAHWLRIQDCSDDETIYDLLLASAAIPFCFPQRTINGQAYVDGGLADNVPLKSLEARGCTHAIVIHLENGSTWNRHDFPHQTVVEIRPEQRINQSTTPILGSFSDLLNFSAARIAELKQRGYEDAKRCMQPILETFTTIHDQRNIHHSLSQSTEMLLNDAPLL